MRIRRDILLVAGLFLGLVLFMIYGATNDHEGTGTSATSHASGDQGTLALYRWLESLDYRVERLEYCDFALTAETDLLFVLAPSISYSQEEAELVAAWVEAGGTLIVADDRPGRFMQSAPLFGAFEVSVLPNEHVSQIARAFMLQPITLTPATDQIRVHTYAMVQSEHPGSAPLIGPSDAPTLLGMQYGAGYVYASSAIFPFTNEGLAAQGNPQLLLNLLRRIPSGGAILFDEYHHGFVGEPSLRDLLLGSPWGWAILYALVVSLIYILLIGRRFGRPVPLREETARRSSSEFVESMAGLLQRGKKQPYILKHYRAAFRRRLAKPYRLPTSLDDDAFVAALAELRPLDAPALRTLLRRLDQPQISDQELLQVIAAADKFR